MKNNVLLGGWKIEEEEIDEELADIFLKATEGYTDTSLKPLRVVGRQVVSGMNYRFLYEKQTISTENEKEYFLVTVYRNLKGHCRVIDVKKTTD